MSADRSTFYITTAIDYPNSDPHMGHAYEKVVADFYARSYRIRGYDTRFLIGLDEHGQKIEEVAREKGMPAQAFVDDKAVVFHKLYDLLEISRDDFIRTSEPRHHEFVTDLYERVSARGDIYKGVYRADYCISCERALTKSELVDGKCPTHDRPTTPVDEESYFFRLGKYRDAIREHIEKHPHFVVPEERRNEMLARLRTDVLDLSISRSTFQWGIPLPDDRNHVLYVWFDALSNYLSALKKPRDLSQRFWPADCHVIGKDILWFHAGIWPAMLLSAGLALPRQVYVHGFILDKDGRKMAKHQGNVVDPLKIAAEYSVDVLRYYFLRAFASGQDGRFSVAELEERYQSELAHDLGNLVRRVAKLATTRCGGEVSPGAGGPELDATETVERFFGNVDRREHHRALDALWAFIRRTNGYLNEKAPWKMKDGEGVQAVIYNALEALRSTFHLLYPVMPDRASRAAGDLGFEIGAMDGLEPWTHTYRVRLGEPLFPARERATKPKSGSAGIESRPPKAPSPGTAVDPFAKLELRVGRIDEVRVHPDADELYAMSVDIGGEKRSICAGLREHLRPEDLEDRKVLVVANLKPAALRGIESRGMILAADRRDGKIVPVDPGDAESGDLVKVEGIESRPKKKLSLSEFKKAPLIVRGGRVTYEGKPLVSNWGEVRCDSDDGASVR